VEYVDLNSPPTAEATVVIAPWNIGGTADWNGDTFGWQRVAGDPVRHWAVWFRTSDPRLSGPISMGNGR
jgi:hypothetical protein